MIERLLCMLRRRHEYRFRSEAGVTFLACVYCGYRSTGWELGAPPSPTRTRESLRLLLGEPVEDGDVEATPIPLSSLSRRSLAKRAHPEFRLHFDA